MKDSIDPAQYGNQKNLSIQHYLVRLLHRIVTNLDWNSKGDVNAVLSMFIDWKQAYSRQCHTLGVQSFINNGVRASLIPLLISYFEDREMRVKWHGVISRPRKLPGGGAMGASLGNWEFLSQTNDNADCVPPDDRFKFVDDLTTIEIINLVNIGLSSLRIKNQVPLIFQSTGNLLRERISNHNNILIKSTTGRTTIKWSSRKRKLKPWFSTSLKTFSLQHDWNWRGEILKWWTKWES